MFNFDPITTAVLIAVIPTIITLVGGWVVYLVNLGISKLPQNQQPVIHGLVQKAVLAASQVVSDTAGNAAKKSYAIQSAQEQAAHLHLNVPTEVLSSLIEASVKEMKMANQALAQSGGSVA